MKECFKCKVLKPLSEFYKHKQMADGHLNKCKACTKADVKQNRDDNIDYYLEYDRRRANAPHRVSARALYIKTEEGKSSHNKATKAWAERNLVRRSAHLLVDRALKNGSLIRPTTCSECGKKGRIHAHHDDYSHPLSVRWLCSKCHIAWHKVNEEKD